MSAGVIAVLFLAFYIFEKNNMPAERLVIIAVLSALSSAGRGLFAAIPSAQPSSFIIIVTGITLGAGAGFMVGALTAVLSGLLLGIGPWTPWQMFAWGLMGLCAGLLSGPLSRHKWLRVAYGAVWGFLFGWIMNLWMLISMGTAGDGFLYILTIYAASFVFDALHAVFNALLILFGGSPFIKALSRVAVKYGLTPKPNG